MKITKLSGLAAIALIGATAAADAPSPAVTWAGCAGALVASAMLSDDKARTPELQSLARRALAKAKVAENPQGLTETQIEGLAMSTARTYLDDARAKPEQRAKLDSLAASCAGLAVKLPD